MTGGSKTYIPKNFYTKTTYLTLLSEKFGGSGAPPRPFCTSPLASGMQKVFCHLPYIKDPKAGRGSGSDFVNCTLHFLTCQFQSCVLLVTGHIIDECRPCYYKDA
ncbi:hypothetical protein Hdeb2414_s0020g00557761 [Helianthus debilis subsp. tardiflorus]